MPTHPKPNAFAKTIRAILNKNCRRKKIAILFTGGTDSTVLAILSQELNPLLVFAAVDDAECLDYNRRSITICRKTARAIGLRFIIVPIRKKDYLRQALPVSRVLRQPINDPDLPAVMHLFKQLRKKRITAVISGMGADEVFHLPAHKLPTFLKKEAAVTLHSHTRIARLSGMAFICPFLSPTVTRLAMATPWPKRKNKQPLKEILAAHPHLSNFLQTGIAAHSFIPENFVRPLRLILAKTAHGLSTGTASKE